MTGRDRNIDHLEGLARMDAIAAEMWGQPEDGRNHNAKLAELLGITDRQIRRIRASGAVSPKVMARLMTEWRLWRTLEQGRIRKRRLRDQQQARKRAREERIRALRERGQ